LPNYLPRKDVLHTPFLQTKRYCLPQCALNRRQIKNRLLRLSYFFPIYLCYKVRMTLPLVTVICICYNHEEFVQQALLSVLNQSYKNIELIVVNNGSSDNYYERS